MKQKGRGCSEELCSADGDVVLVKWFDNKAVSLASNYVGKGEEDTVRRWSSERSKYIDIKRPQIVRDYNKSMGGVDTLDQMVSLYRIYIRSRKWTLQLITHAVDLALVNSWLAYRQEYTKADLPKAKALDLLNFRMQVAEGLMRAKTPCHKRKGRLSDPIQTKRKARSLCENRPIEDVRYDMVDHMPMHSGNKEAGRCKLEGCKTGRSHFLCEKCKVHLCLSKAKNCFAKFHRQI